MELNERANKWSVALRELLLKKNRLIYQFSYLSMTDYIYIAKLEKKLKDDFWCIGYMYLRSQFILIPLCVVHFLAVSFSQYLSPVNSNYWLGINWKTVNCPYLNEPHLGGIKITAEIKI